jgi:hypothetical protein
MMTEQLHKIIDGHLSTADYWWWSLINCRRWMITDQPQKIEDDYWSIVRDWWWSLIKEEDCDDIDNLRSLIMITDQLQKTNHDYWSTVISIRKSMMITDQQQNGRDIPPPPPPPPARRLSHFLWLVTYSSGGMASRMWVTGDSSSTFSSGNVQTLNIFFFLECDVLVPFGQLLCNTRSRWAKLFH